MKRIEHDTDEKQYDAHNRKIVRHDVVNRNPAQGNRDDCIIISS